MPNKSTGTPHLLAAQQPELGTGAVEWTVGAAHLRTVEGSAALPPPPLASRPAPSLRLSPCARTVLSLPPPLGGQDPDRQL